jgi:hypothetical protein
MLRFWNLIIIIDRIISHVFLKYICFFIILLINSKVKILKILLFL